MPGKVVRVFIILFFLCLPVSAQDVITDLLRLDRSIRTDSIYSWHRLALRQKNSAPAMADAINKMMAKARETNDKEAIAISYFIKGQYYCNVLKNSKMGIQYIQQAIKIAKKEGLEIDWAMFMHHLGMYFFYKDNISSAIEYLIRADEKFTQLGYTDKQAGQYHYNIAYVYFHLHNYNEALKYLLAAHRNTVEDHYIQQQIENTTGLVYMELNKMDSAEIYFQKTFNIATAYKDTVWMGIASGNIGDIYLKRGMYDTAMLYYKENYKYCMYDNTGAIRGNRIGTLTSMAEINIAKGNIAAAMNLLNDAIALMNAADDPDYWRQVRLYEITAKAYTEIRDYEKANLYGNMAKVITDSLNRKENALRYTSVQEQIKSEKLIAAQKILESENKLGKQKIYFLLLAMGLLGIIGGLLYNRRRLKIKKDIEIRDKKEKLLESQRLMAETELENAQQQLEQYVKSINEKNELIEQINIEIIKSDHHSPGLSIIDKTEYIQKLNEFSLLTDDDWGKFKTLFIKVHKGFFVNVKNKNPELSEADLRLLSLSKLNISTKQIANMLGISAASVRTGRYRLRKKLNLSDEKQFAEMA